MVCELTKRMQMLLEEHKDSEEAPEYMKLVKRYFEIEESME